MKKTRLQRLAEVEEAKKSKSDFVIQQFHKQMMTVDSIVSELKIKINLLDIWKTNILDKLQTYLGESTKAKKMPKAPVHTMVHDLNGHKTPLKKVPQKLNRPIITPCPRSVIKVTKNVAQQPEREIVLVKQPKIETVNSDVSNVTPNALKDAKKMIKKIMIKTKNGFLIRHQCQICWRNLTMPRNAKLHVLRVHFKKRMACEECNTKVYDYKTLRQHRQTCHKNPLKTPRVHVQASRYSLRRITKYSVPGSTEDYQNLIVQNPFPNFDLKKALGVTVLLQRLQTPPIIKMEPTIPKGEVKLEPEEIVEFKSEDDQSPLIEISQFLDLEINENYGGHPPPILQEEPSVPTCGLSTIPDTEVGQLFGHVSPINFDSLGFADVQKLNAISSTHCQENYSNYVNGCNDNSVQDSIFPVPMNGTDPELCVINSNEIMDISWMN